MKNLRQFLRKPTGWWTGRSLAEHHCEPPGMPAGAPAALIWRCPICSQEWRWRPAYRHVWSARTS